MTGHLAVDTRAWLFRGLLGLVCVVSWAGIVSADTVATIVAVEEDWELVIATPDPDTTGPQVICTLSPHCTMTGLYATLELNHQTVPDFYPGGLQFELWNGEALVTERRAPTQAVLSHADEVIRWTQKMELADGMLNFEIVDGSSTTWGSFGGQGYLKAAVASNLESLNGYNPAVSVENSGVSYAANRVQSLVLKRVRLITADGEVLEDTTPRVVHQQ
jgi:hypothetical protein